MTCSPEFRCPPPHTPKRLCWPKRVRETPPCSEPPDVGESLGQNTLFVQYEPFRRPPKPATRVGTSPTSPTNSADLLHQTLTLYWLASRSVSQLSPDVSGLDS